MARRQYPTVIGQLYTWNGTAYVPVSGTDVGGGVYAANMIAYQITKTGGYRTPAYSSSERFGTIPITAFVAGTPQTILTPAAGKKWVITAGTFTLSVSGQLIVKSNGTEVWRSQATTAVAIPANVTALLINDVLQIDTTASGNISGWVGIYEC